MSDAYLLGYAPREWERLTAQQEVWGETLLGDLRAAGLRRDSSVLEVGCGPGAWLEALAPEVDEPVHGIERDPASAAAAGARLGARAVIHAGDLREVDPRRRFHLVLCRWVLSFLPDAAGAVGRMAQWVAPGGALVVHDYLHDALRVYPEQSEVLDVIEAIRGAFRDTGGDLWVAGRVPPAMAAAGLVVEGVRPHVLAGPPDSPVFGWVERFLHEHVDGVEATGRLRPGGAAAFRAAWARTRSAPGAMLYSPLVVGIVGRRVSP